MRRVVITGMGIVSSIGNNTQEVLASLHEAKSGITRAEKYAEMGFRSQVQGAPTLNPADVIDRRAMRFLGEGAAWNHIAMEQAIQDSGLQPSEVSDVRTGIIMGSGGPSARTIVEAAQLAGKFSQASEDSKVVIHYTPRNARTGEFTPPGINSMALEKSSSDRM